MKKRISPASGLQIKGVKQQFILAPCATLLLLALAFVFVPYAEASLRASAASTGNSEVTVGLTQAWASITTASSNTSLDAGVVTGRTLMVGSNDAIAATNSPNGYKLYLSASNTEDNTAAMMSGEYDDPRISSAPSNAIAAFKTTDASTDNTWGYAVKGSDAISGFSGSYSTGKITSGIDNYKFRGFVPTSTSATASDGLIAQSATASTNGTITNVYYGAYVNAGTPGGTYTASVTYTMVAESVNTGDPTPNPNDPTVPGQEGKDPNRPSGSDDRYAYTTSTGTPAYYNYSGSGVSGDYYSYEAGGTKVTALGVSSTKEENKTVTTIANINDGNITWAAVAIIAGASATFLAIALLRDREDEDEE